MKYEKLNKKELIQELKRERRESDIMRETMVNLSREIDRIGGGIVSARAYAKEWDKKTHLQDAEIARLRKRLSASVSQEEKFSLYRQAVASLFATITELREVQNTREQLEHYQTAVTYLFTEITEL